MADPNPPENSLDLSANLSAFMNLSVNSAIFASTPTSTPSKARKERAHKAASPFKRPKPVQQGPVVATCNICGKEYRLMWYYKKHMQGHVLTEIAFRAPLDMEELLESDHKIGGKVLDRMASKPSVGCYAEVYSSLLAQLKEKESDAPWINLVKFLCGHFKSVIAKELFCMPSSLLNRSQKVKEDVLSDEEIRNKLYSELEEICRNTPHLVISTFWCEFVHTFSDELLIFICRSLRETTDQDIPTINFDSEERQCIFYVAGSICIGFKRFSYKYPGSKKWRHILEAIQSKYLEDKLPEQLTEQEKKDRNWTEGQNRGGLLFIRGSAQRFVISVAEVVASYEDTVKGLEAFL